MPKLLDMLSLKGTIVTTDALNCQRAIARQIAGCPIQPPVLPHRLGIDEQRLRHALNRPPIVQQCPATKKVVTILIVALHNSNNTLILRCTGLGVSRRIIVRRCARSADERIVPLMPGTESNLQHAVM